MPVFRQVNRALAVILKQADTTMFATCFYVVADVERAQLRFANVGHPSALHIQHGNGAAHKLQGNGPPDRPWEFSPPPVMSRQAVR